MYCPKQNTVTSGMCQTEISLNFSSIFLPCNFVLNSCCCFVFVNIFAGPIRTCWWSWGSGIARNNCTWLEFAVLNYSSLDISDYKIQYSGWFRFSNKWGPVRPVPTKGGGTGFEKYFFWSCGPRFGHEFRNTLISLRQIWCKKEPSGKSGAKMINAAFAPELTSPCKTTDVNAAFTKSAAWFPPILHFFTSNLSQANLMQI